MRLRAGLPNLRREAPYRVLCGALARCEKRGFRVVEYSVQTNRVPRTPSEVRNALVYVLQNARKHGAWFQSIDPYSSGAWFDAWKRNTVRLVSGARPPTARARTWLLTHGWRRRGLLEPGESPRGA